MSLITSLLGVALVATASSSGYVVHEPPYAGDIDSIPWPKLQNSVSDREYCFFNYGQYLSFASDFIYEPDYIQYWDIDLASSGSVDLPYGYNSNGFLLLPYRIAWDEHGALTNFSFLFYENHNDDFDWIREHYVPQLNSVGGYPPLYFINFVPSYCGIYTNLDPRILSTFSLEGNTSYTFDEIDWYVDLTYGFGTSVDVNGFHNTSTLSFDIETLADAVYCSYGWLPRASVANVGDVNSYFDDGFNKGREQGRSEGKAEGETIGYIKGQESVTDETSSVFNLFGAVASVPISILNGLAPFTFWDVSLIGIAVTFLFIALILWIVRKFI